MIELLVVLADLCNAMQAGNLDYLQRTWFLSQYVLVFIIMERL